MAKIKYSALVSDMRNKLNGSVASKNRYGSYLRNKVTPVNPQSSFQQNVRQRLASFSASWRELTQAQRQSWIAGSINFPFTDIFGDVKYLSGQTLFVKLNSNLDKIGQPSVDVAPLPVGIPEIAATAITAEVTGGVITDLSLTVTPTTTPAGYSWAVYATPPVAPGINFVKNRFRFLGTGTVAAGDLDILTAYSARFGAIGTEDQRIFVRLALVNNTTGQQGVPVEIVGTIVAGE